MFGGGERREELSLGFPLRLWEGGGAAEWLTPPTPPRERLTAEGASGEKAEQVYAVFCLGHQPVRLRGLPMIAQAELGTCYSRTLSRARAAALTLAHTVRYYVSWGRLRLILPGSHTGQHVLGPLRPPPLLQGR